MVQGSFLLRAGRAGMLLGLLLGLAPEVGVALSAAAAAAPGDPAASAPAERGFYWTDGPELYPFVPLAVVAGGDRYVLWSEVNAADVAGPVRVRRERPDGSTAWSVAVPAVPGIAASDHAFLVGGALAATPERIYLAQYQRIATGCALSALSAVDGHMLWTVRLEGAGPVSHSKYNNRVQLAVMQGDPVVRGWESAARYLERREGATGRLLSNDKLTNARFFPDVNEAIYLELARMLRRSPRYEVSVSDFVTRHVLGERFPDQAARRTLARDALSRLGGLPVYATPWRMQLSQTESADGRDVRLQASR